MLLRKNHHIRILLWLLAMLGLASLGLPAARAQDQAPVALVLTADGPVSPNMLEYIQRGIGTAERNGAELLILQLDTPGGGVVVMGQITQAILASRTPVIVYVSPHGAMAGSAGTVITLSGHAAAMAPETIIGAASPVGPSGQDLETTEAIKEKEAIKASVRTMVRRRPPEAISLAEQTIDSARAVSAREALQVGLVDFIATDVNDLLKQLDGFKVEVNGTEKTLRTANITVTPLPLSLIESVLQTLTDPNIVFLLLQVGVLAVLIEISSPGGWVAGFVGVVCLALATYGLGILPVNWFGLIFLATAFVLFILDIKAPTHGALTVAGTLSLIVGALVLFNSPGVPVTLRVSPPLIVFTSLLVAAGFGLIVSFAVRAQRVPVLAGAVSLNGQTGTARTDLAPRGTVQIGGELWSAELVPEETLLPKGSRVEVVSLEGFKLVVRKAMEESPRTADRRPPVE